MIEFLRRKKERISVIPVAPAELKLLLCQRRALCAGWLVLPSDRAFLKHTDRSSPLAESDECKQAVLQTISSAGSRSFRLDSKRSWTLVEATLLTQICSKGLEARASVNGMIVKNKKGFTRVNGQLISHMLNYLTARFKIGRGRQHSYEAKLMVLSAVHPTAHEAHDGPWVASGRLYRHRNWPLVCPATSHQIAPVTAWSLISITDVSPAQPPL